PGDIIRSLWSDMRIIEFLDKMGQGGQFRENPEISPAPLPERPVSRRGGGSGKSRSKNAKVHKIHAEGLANLKVRGTIEGEDVQGRCGGEDHRRPPKGVDRRHNPDLVPIPVFVILSKRKCSGPADPAAPLRLGAYPPPGETFGRSCENEVALWPWR